MPPTAKQYWGKPCKKCDKIIDETNFRFDKNQRISGVCRNCDRMRMKIFMQNKRNKEEYNITQEEYESKKELQLGGCAICKYPCSSGRNLSVDHDHKTGKVRDLLCRRCNLLVGLAGEDEELLFAIIEYLKRHKQKIA